MRKLQRLFTRECVLETARCPVCTVIWWYLDGFSALYPVSFKEETAIWSVIHLYSSWMREYWITGWKYLKALRTPLNSITRQRRPRGLFKTQSGDLRKRSKVIRRVKCSVWAGLKIRHPLFAIRPSKVAVRGTWPRNDGLHKNEFRLIQRPAAEMMELRVDRR